MMASAQVVETSVANNTHSRDSNNPDDLFQSRYVTPALKLFSYCHSLFTTVPSIFVVSSFISQLFFFKIKKGLGQRFFTPLISF